MQLDIFDLLDAPDPNLNSRLKALNCQLIIWGFEYYQKDKPTATDAEYDGVYQEYKSLLNKTSYRPFNDMIKQVGSPSKMAYHAALMKGVHYG